MVEVCVLWGMTAKIQMWGGLANWLYYAPTNPPRQALCAYNGRNHHMAENLYRASCPCHFPEYHPGPWKASPIATWHPRENWVGQRDSFPEQPHLGHHSNYRKCNKFHNFFNARWNIKKDNIGKPNYMALWDQNGWAYFKNPYFLDWVKEVIVQGISAI